MILIYQSNLPLTEILYLSDTTYRLHCWELLCKSVSYLSYDNKNIIHIDWWDKIFIEKEHSKNIDRSTMTSLSVFFLFLFCFIWQKPTDKKQYLRFSRWLRIEGNIRSHRHVSDIIKQNRFIMWVIGLQNRRRYFRVYSHSITNSFTVSKYQYLLRHRQNQC